MSKRLLKKDFLITATIFHMWPDKKQASFKKFALDHFDIDIDSMQVERIGYQFRFYGEKITITLLGVEISHP